jgi:hypothetical protein
MRSLGRVGVWLGVAFFAGISGVASAVAPDVNVSLGDLPEGKTVAFKFDATVKGGSFSSVSNTGSVSGSNFATVSTNTVVTTVTRPNTTVSGVTRDLATPTALASVTWTVTFADSVSGVTSSNFALVTTLGGVPVITGVAAIGGSPSTQWTVTAGTGSGSGTLGLNLINDDNLDHAVTTPKPVVGDVYGVDHDAPDTLIDTSPANPTTSATAAFTFHGNDGTGVGVASFECKLDSGSFTACLSGQTYSGLADGSHTFQVRAIDGAGNVDATPASFTWVVDTTAPDTTITSNPSNPTGTGTASFSFVGNDGSGSGIASFECKLDTASFVACTSPQALSGLADGSHTFQVRAKDSVGLTDPTPASYTWVVDTTAPETTIDAPKPANPTNDPSATFTFHGDDGNGSGGLTFTCQLDGGGFTPCTSPKSYVSLSDGSHTFQVKAKDAVGNVDATPASVTWTIDATPPDTVIDAKPNNPVNSTTASFQFHGDDGSGVGGLVLECKLDSGAFAACATATTQSYTGLAEGSHTFQVRAKDSLANTDATPASYTWTVDTTKPTVSVSSSTASPTNTSPIHVTITFSEPVTGFTPTTASGDIVIGGVGGTGSNPAGSGASYSFDLTPSGQGAVTVQVPANSAQDAATNFNDLPSNTFSITYDSTSPTVTINQAAGQLDPAHGTAAIKFTVVFSEAVTGFAGTDVALSGTAVPTTATVTPVSATTYTVAVSGMSKSGTVIASIAAGAAQDSAGNLSLAATSTDNTVTYFRTEISDFNGDGKSDLIWQDSNGTPVVWYLNGTTFSGSGDSLVFPGSPAGWRIAGVGDFNGDGKVDLVAQNGNTISIGVMNGKTVQSTQTVPTAVPSGWFLRAVADFDGDGQSDLVLQNQNGSVVVWLMNGNPATVKSGVVVYGSALPGWTVRGAADFTGDDQPDILLQHDNGTVVVWPMTGTTMGTGITVSGPVAGWTVRGTADLDGDGKTDIVWQYTDGRINGWLMNGTTLKSGITIYSSAVPGWTIQAVR